MTRTRTRTFRGSQPGSPDRSSEDDDDDAKSPKDEKTPIRGRKELRSENKDADAMDTVS